MSCLVLCPCPVCENCNHQEVVLPPKREAWAKKGYVGDKKNYLRYNSRSEGADRNCEYGNKVVLYSLTYITPPPKPCCLIDHRTVLSISLRGWMLPRLGRLVGYDKCYGNENLMAFGPRDSTEAVLLLLVLPIRSPVRNKRRKATLVDILCFRKDKWNGEEKNPLTQRYAFVRGLARYSSAETIL